MKGPAAEGLDVRDRVATVESLLEEVDGLPDPVAREKANAALAALLDLYGEGLGRIIDEVAARDDGTMAEALGGDELVSHLLLVHGLHPVPLPDRVRGALQEVRPYLESHGGNVELLSVEGGVARLRMQGSCSGCPSSSVTLKLAIENAIRKAAPDIEEIEAEDAVAEGAPQPPLLQIELQNGGPAESDGDGSWATAGGLPELRGAGPLLKTVGGEPLLFVRCNGEPYAYRPSCPACGESLAEATLTATELACPGCASRFDVLRAGRCLDSPQLHLDPVPLLVDENGLVRVALGVSA